MTRKDRMEFVIKGLFLVLTLFVSTLVALLINGDIQHLLIARTFIIPIAVGYCLLGIFIRWMLYRSTLRKKGFSLFSGAAAIYWLWLFIILLMVGAHWIPQVIRYIILINAAALLLVWSLDFLYMKNIAKELNSGVDYSSRMLVEDLPWKPQTEDMFMQEIQNYCNKNNLSLEIIEYGIPAKIKMNNTLYMVQLGQYYTVLGSIVHTLEFHNVVSKTGS